MKIKTLKKIGRKVFGNLFFSNSKEYWEKRYSTGGNSGRGSYGKFAEFKAEIINEFVKNNEISSVIEFGCGDGNNLSLFNIPNYIGLDISKTVIQMCVKKFKNDKTKHFFLYDPIDFDNHHNLFKADLTLSLDVIYHIIEDKIFDLYMKHLFLVSKKYVIIYSSDSDDNQNSPLHLKNRRFSKWIEKNLPEWELIKKIDNKYLNKSTLDFFIYKRSEKKEEVK